MKITTGLLLAAILLAGCGAEAAQSPTPSVLTLLAPTGQPTAENATATATARYTETATLSPTPTSTQTSTPGLGITEITPCGAAICEIPEPDEQILARLCVVEVRGFAEMRDIACHSVISTVLTRMADNIYSDNTVAGTITWGCTPEAGCTQFPGFVVNGCAGIVAQACPWSYPDEIAYFVGVARDALSRGAGDPRECRGYLYYDSRPNHTGPVCTIQASNGEVETFHNN